MTETVVCLFSAGQSVPGWSILLNNSLSYRLPFQASKGWASFFYRCIYEQSSRII